MPNQLKPGRFHVGGYLPVELVDRFKVKLHATGETMTGALRRLIENDLKGGK